MTKTDRLCAVTRLSKMFDTWKIQSNETLLIEVQKTFPTCVSATRDECLQYLVIEYVNKAFNIF